MDGARFPWGNTWPKPGQVNAILGSHKPHGLVPVDSPGFERGESADGIEQLIGNAEEWTATRGRYAAHGRFVLQGDWNGRGRVLTLAVMGSGWLMEPEGADSPYYVSGTDAVVPTPQVGFRCVETTS